MNQIPSAPEEEFKTAYEQYSDAIFRHCYFRLFDRERGRDIMQETFIRVWGYLNQGKKVDNMRAFLYRIANNLIIDDVRKKKEMSLDELQEKGFDPGYDGTKDMQRRIDEGRVFTMLDKIPDEFREVIIMRYVDGLSPADIGSILEIPANTVSVRLHRGIKHLHALLSA